MGKRTSKTAAATPSRGLRVLAKGVLFVALAAGTGLLAATVPVGGRTLASRVEALLGGAEPVRKLPRPHAAEARLPAELARTAVVLPDAHAADLIKPDEKQALDSLIQRKTERRAP
jgi:hypothetical protein